MGRAAMRRGSRGDLVLPGPIGPAQAVEAVSYSAEFGALGKVEVEVK